MKNTIDFDFEIILPSKISLLKICLGGRIFKKFRENGPSRGRFEAEVKFLFWSNTIHLVPTSYQIVAQQSQQLSIYSQFCRIKILLTHPVVSTDSY